MKRSKLVYLLIVVSLLSLLTGCKSKDYKDATEAVQAGYYKRAFFLLSELGNYKDSKKLLESILSPYTIELAREGKAQEAYELLEMYPNISNFDEIKNDITYFDAIYSFRYEGNSNFQDGIAALKTLPKGFRNSEDLIAEYERLSNSPFIGSWVANTVEPITGFEFVIRLGISLEYSSSNFSISCKKTIEYDGTDMISSEYGASSNNVTENEMLTGPNKNKYTISGEKLREYSSDSGITYYSRIR